MRASIGNWVIAVATALTTTIAPADEPPRTLDELPAVVIKTIHVKYPGGKIVRGERALESGQPVFEVGVEHKGKTIDLVIHPQGRILGTEKPVTGKDLPRVVRDALAKRYGNIQILSAKEFVKATDESARPAYYIVMLRVGGKRYDTEIAPDGKIGGLNR